MTVISRLGGGNIGWRGTPASHQEKEGRGDVGQKNTCSESNRKIRAGVIPKKQKSDKKIQARWQGCGGMGGGVQIEGRREKKRGDENTVCKQQLFN